MLNLNLLGVYNHVRNSTQLISIVYTAKVDREPEVDEAEIENAGWFAWEDALSLDFAVNCGKRVAEFYKRRNTG